ncbi:MAG: cyclic nucleotide-binding domain-containing protein [Burkholderiales bacterium]|nr:cyclic nucleotide-binding domain-containing protein [Burkholderiales bacterium]
MSQTDLAVTTPGASSAAYATYDPAIALEFFKAAGTPEDVAPGTTFFVENEKGSRLLMKRDRMYLLLEGEVSLVAGKRPIGRVGKGEIFGEMASLTHSPRSATALAKSRCRMIGLDERAFEIALTRNPGFALMLLSVLIGRLREANSQLISSGALSEDRAWKDAYVFERKVVAELVKEFEHEAPKFYDAKRAIMQEGQVGLYMYVVLKGSVVIFLSGSPVERVGPGGVFGELALIDQQPRAASAVAETDCSLLAISRKALLELIKTKPAFGKSLLAAVADRGRFMVSRLR